MKSTEKFATIEHLAQGLINGNKKVTVHNLITESLFLSGGNFVNEVQAMLYLDNNLVAIGFCQPKYYKRSVWTKAVKVMEYLIELGYVEANDFGRGKGKYDTTEKAKGMSNEDLLKVIFE